MEHFGISPWTAYTEHVAIALCAVAFLLAVLFIGAFFVINYGLMTRRDRDQSRGGQEPSDVGFLQRERFKGARSHREYLPAEEGDEEYWRPEEQTSLSDDQLLHEENMPADLPHVVRQRRERIREKRDERRAKGA